MEMPASPIVLAASVDAGERLFMEQATQTMLLGSFLEDFHEEHVVVGSQVAGFKYGRNFELCRRNFIMSAF